MKRDSATGEYAPMNSPPHLDAATIADYRARRLEPGRILAIHDHAAQCNACQNLLAPLTEPDEQHLSEEDAVAFVAGNSVAGNPDFAAHLATCTECRVLVEDLRAFRSELAAETRRTTSPWWQYAAAAAVLLAVGTTLWLNSTSRAQPQSEPRLVAALNDGPVVPDWPQSTRQLVATALSSGRLPEPQYASVQAPPASLRSIQTSAPAFAPLSPAGTRELSDRPLFRWTPLEGARSYEVTIFDTDLNQVARSGALAKTDWQPETALPRLKPLTWQVAAVKGGERVTAPQPPQPAAVFEIISAEAAREIEIVKAAPQPAHLALAALYAREGLRDLAAAELKSLAEANPNSELVRSLQKSLP